MANYLLAYMVYHNKTKIVKTELSLMMITTELQRTLHLVYSIEQMLYNRHLKWKCVYERAQTEQL